MAEKKAAKHNEIDEHITIENKGSHRKFSSLQAHNFEARHAISTKCDN